MLNFHGFSSFIPVIEWIVGHLKYGISQINLKKSCWNVMSVLYYWMNCKTLKLGDTHEASTVFFC